MRSDGQDPPRHPRMRAGDQTRAVPPPLHERQGHIGPTGLGRRGVRSTLTLRQAGASDADLLLEWRNNPEAVRFSVSRREVGPAEHRQWLAHALASPTTRLWIAERGGIAVGQVRLDPRTDGHEVSLAVAPRERGRGVGLELLGGLMALAVTEGLQPLLARVDRDNVASIRVFLRAGFVQTRADARMIHLRWPQ